MEIRRQAKTHSSILQKNPTRRNQKIQNDTMCDRSGRSGACRQFDQTWQGVWLHNRDILSASCMCIDNTAVTFQKYIGFGLSGLENPTQQNKKRADHTYALFSFSWFDIFLYVSALYVVISIQIAKKKLSAVCLGLAAIHIC